MGPVPGIPLAVPPALNASETMPQSFPVSHDLSCSAACACLATQVHLILHDPVDHSPPGPSVHGILQVRILEWVAIPFSSGSSQPGIEPASLMSLA